MCDVWCEGALATEAVEGSALTLESVDDVEGGDSLALGMFGVGDSVTDDPAGIFSSCLKGQEGGMSYDSRKDLRTPRVSS